MNLPNWQTLPLERDVLREPMPDATRIVFWLPGPREGGMQNWERIGNVPGVEADRERGICAVPATAVKAQQKLQGPLGKLFDRLLPRAAGQKWILPSGDSATQVGDRLTDLVLAWSENEAAPADEARLKTRWPEATRLQKVAPNLYLVGGIRSSNGLAVEPPPQGNPREQADYLLNVARQAGDPVREATALIDLAIAYMRANETPRAVIHLEQALAIARQLENRGLEIDALGNLGLAFLEMGQWDRSLETLDQQLSLARATGDSFVLKTALENQGVAWARLGEHARALTSYEEALNLAKSVEDIEHQAELMWFVAIEHAEMGQRDQAIVHARNSIGLFEQLGNPQTPLLTKNLESFLASTDMVLAALPAGSAPIPPEGATGMLRMAIAFAKSVAKFVESGFKTVTQQVYQKRLQKCSSCRHHTGVRCKLCGCFTSAKAWLPHEVCPIGKWPTPNK